MNSQDNGRRFKIQTISITISSMIASAIQGIVGYVAVYFFKPIWEKFVSWLNSKTKN